MVLIESSLEVESNALKVIKLLNIDKLSFNADIGVLIEDILAIGKVVNTLHFLSHSSRGEQNGPIYCGFSILSKLFFFI